MSEYYVELFAVGEYVIKDSKGLIVKDKLSKMDVYNANGDLESRVLGKKVKKEIEVVEDDEDEVLDDEEEEE